MRVGIAVALSALPCACSLLVDTGGFDGTGTEDAAPPTAAGDGSATNGSVTPAAPGACPSEGRSCVPEAPAGWEGPVFLFDGPASDVPTCPASMAVARANGHSGFSAPPAHTCEPCTCGTATGGTCTATVSGYNALDCSGTAIATRTLTTACVDPTGSSIGVVVTGTGGTCAPAGGKPVLPAVPWGASVRACGAPELLRTGCAPGSICAPTPPGPFRLRHCITRAGESACPGAPYDDRVLVHADVEDARACSACTCGSPSDGCTGVATTWDIGMCFFGNGTKADLPGQSCFKSSDVESLKLVSTTRSGTCPASGGAPSGQVKPAKPTTVCCMR